MDNIQKMLRAIINGQSSFRQEILGRIDRMEKRLDGKIDRVEERLTERLDKIGRQLAYLEDDTPTREDNLLASQ